jgi:hypothetical protein
MASGKFPAQGVWEKKAFWIDLKIRTLKVANGMIESRNTKEIERDSVKQSSLTNSLADRENSL